MTGNNGSNENSRADLEVEARVSGYSATETTSELYDLGKVLLLEGVDRAHWADSKAGTLAGFSGAVIALLLSTLSSWKPFLTAQSPSLRVAMFAGIVFVLAAGLFAFIAIANRTFDWVSPKKAWLSETYLNYPDLLLRSYILAMYQAIASHSKKNEDKMFYLNLAQLAFLFGGVFLGGTLVLIVGNALWS